MKDLWFFLKLFKPHSTWLAGGIFLSLLTALASIALLTLSCWFISSSAKAGLVAIALARLYLKNSPVLILDEPTEGLDSETEWDVFKALADFARDKTVIMVTHREAGLGLVDVVFRMERGVLRKL